MPLSDTQIRNTRPGKKTFKLFDERGLYLEVSPNGGRWWRLKYRIAGKEKRLSLGVYPDVSLKDARERRDDARKSVAAGIDPSEARKASKAAVVKAEASIFETLAREWYKKQEAVWDPSHGKRILARLERDIFPYLGKRPIDQITAPELLSVVRRIENRGAIETAHRALSNCGQIFRYAVASGLAPRDVAADLRGALPPVKTEHFAAVTDPDEVGKLLAKIDNYKGTHVVRCALQLAPLVFVRPGELRKAEWSAFDLDKAQWQFITEKTKTNLIVPLPTQALAILKELQPLTGAGQYVFTSARSTKRPMSDNAVLAALRSMGIPNDVMTGHGFRAMARTLLDEVLGFRPDIIEHQLAHAVKDPNGRAYNRTAHLEDRKKMMQQWADYLGTLREKHG